MRKMFSEKQIKEMASAVSEDVIDESIEEGSIKTELDKKANLNGAEFTGAVSAPTFEQEEPNWNGNLAYKSGVSTGLERTDIYNSAKIINNVLHLVLCFKLTNNTENSISQGSAIIFNTTSVPSEYRSKIVDIEGETLDTEITRTILIRCGSAVVSNTNGGSQSANCCMLQHYTYELQFALSMAPSVSVPAGSSKCFFAEMQITLL